MSDDYEHALGGLRGHIVYGEQTAGDTPVEWMQVKVALPYLRGAERALIAERQRADAAEAELARLRAIVAELRAEVDALRPGATIHALRMGQVTSGSCTRTAENTREHPWPACGRCGAAEDADCNGWPVTP